jgi:hypothetical protein
MKYAVEIGSGAMTYITNFMKIGWAFKNVIGGRIHRHTEYMQIS